MVTKYQKFGDGYKAEAVKLYPGTDHARCDEVALLRRHDRGLQADRVDRENAHLRRIR